MITSNLSKVISIETAVPELVVTQDDAMALFEKHRNLSAKEKIFYERFLGDSSIEKRHVAADRIEDVLISSIDQAHYRFEKYATQLGKQSLAKALTKAKINAHELDAIIVTTCTGYLCPGLSSYISQHLELRPNVLVYDLVGHGCGAALLAMRLADQLLKSGQCQHVAVISVEICTAAIFFGDSIDLILSNSIFSDGAAACIVSNRSNCDGIVLEGFSSVLWPQFRDELRFIQKDSRLCNVISKYVPGIVANAVKELNQMLPHSQAHYAFHTGGRRILDEISRTLNLSDEQLKYTRQILRDYGNMSSPSVLFVLKEMIAGNTLKHNDEVMMFTFGAGFSAYAALGKYVVNQRGEFNANKQSQRSEAFVNS